jgi:hypothetical protein
MQFENFEVFYMSADDFIQSHKDTWMADSYKESDYDAASLKGWYWWACMPGCLPDSDAIGPFATEQEALEDAQSDD